MRTNRVSPYHSYNEMRERIKERNKKLANVKEFKDRRKRLWI